MFLVEELDGQKRKELELGNPPGTIPVIRAASFVWHPSFVGWRGVYPESIFVMLSKNILWSTVRQLDGSMGRKSDPHIF